MPAVSNGQPPDVTAGRILGSSRGQPPDHPPDEPPDRAQGWCPMTEAADSAGVTRRTLRRWCAEGRVVSQLVGQRGAQVRWIKLDSLRTGPAADLRSEPRDCPTEPPGDTPRTAPMDDRGTVAVLRSERDRLANEVDWLRRQVEEMRAAEREMRAAEREMRVLIARALPDPAPALAERNVTPAVETAKPQYSRVRWWWPFRRQV